MSTLKSACPIPGFNPEMPTMVVITTMEFINSQIKEAQNFLGIEEIGFISARYVRFWIQGKIS